MKQEIHPKYYNSAVVTCSCGNTFSTGSTVEALNVEVCSKCHPFFTGKQKFMDTARRVEKFQARTKKSEEVGAGYVSKKEKRAKKDQAKATGKGSDSKKAAKDALKSALNS